MNIILIPFAYDDNMQSGINMHKDNRLDTYMKNLAVALVTAKHFNPTCDVALATNIKEDELSPSIVQVLKRNDILIFYYPFDRFRFCNSYPWGLAFYKLCCLSYIIETTNYECICYFDSDVIVQNSLDSLWKETNEHIMLYDINHGLNTKNYQIMCKEVNEFIVDKHDSLPTHYGGEFFAACRKNAILFLKHIHNIYDEMIKREYMTTKGDEFIITIAASNCKTIIKNAAAYICRYWTDCDFRLVSTNYKYNAVCILHLPSEKTRGIIAIYNRFVSKGKMPSKKAIWKICRLSHQTLKDRVRYLLMNN